MSHEGGGLIGKEIEDEFGNVWRVDEKLPVDDSGNCEFIAVCQSKAYVDGDIRNQCERSAHINARQLRLFVLHKLFPADGTLNPKLSECLTSWGGSLDNVINFEPEDIVTENGDDEEVNMPLSLINYKRRMMKDFQWGSVAELLQISEIEERQIYCWNETLKDGPQILGRRTWTKKPLHLYFNMRNHYEVLLVTLLSQVSVFLFRYI